MKGNRKRNTRPEIALRSALHGMGARYRCDYAIRVPGRRPIRVDVAFTRVEVAVFVDGCFWHCCPDHSNVPAANHGYWLPKLARNVQRDAEVDLALSSAGWAVVHVWEHEVPGAAAERVMATIRDRRAAQ